MGTLIETDRHTSLNSLQNTMCQSLVMCPLKYLRQKEIFWVSPCLNLIVLLPISAFKMHKM